MMFLLSMLLATVAPQQDNGIEEQAARCGLKPNQLVWIVDAAGQKRAQITPQGHLDSISFASVRCLLDWAAKNGARVGFISEPPPAAKKLDADEVRRIELECGLKEGTLAVDGEHVLLKPSPDEAYEHFDCALARLNNAGLGQRLGFIGNEADANAILRPPLRYVAVGSRAHIAALARAATADKWSVIRSATASDGSVILEFQSGPTMTNGQATKLLDRIWNKKFGDVEFGTAPRRLSDTGPFDD